MELIHKGNRKGAERPSPPWSKEPLGEAFQHLQYEIQGYEVFSTSIAWSSRGGLADARPDRPHMSHAAAAVGAVGCMTVKYDGQAMRKLWPKLFDQYKLLSKPLGSRDAEDAWIDQFSRTIFAASREAAADAVAAALAEGISPDSIGEAISLAANHLVLHDPGRHEA